MDAVDCARIYEEDDKVDDYLLNELSKWVLYHRLPSLARSLGLTQAEYSRIAVATTQPEKQIFQVPSNNGSSTTGCILTELNDLLSRQKMLKMSICPRKYLIPISKFW